MKGVPAGQAEVLACKGNFHGRTSAIVGLSSESQYQEGFGPFPAGLKSIPYNDRQALEAAITPHTAAFLVEPLQGEGGIIVPDAGYLRHCAEICHRHDVLSSVMKSRRGWGVPESFLPASMKELNLMALFLARLWVEGCYLSLCFWPERR